MSIEEDEKCFSLTTSRNIFLKFHLKRERFNFSIFHKTVQFRCVLFNLRQKDMEILGYILCYKKIHLCVYIHIKSQIHKQINDEILSNRSCNEQISFKLKKVVYFYVI